MSFDARLLELGDELRREGMALGTSELLDGFAALEAVGWTDPVVFREALAATLAKSPDDRRIFDLVFERFFFRAAEEQAIRQGVREDGDPDGEPDPGATGHMAAEEGEAGSDAPDFESLRELVEAAIRAGDESAMRDLARLSIAAFGRQGQGSGVLGVDVRRSRRALGLRSEPRPPKGRAAGEAPPLRRDQIRRFEQLLR